ncbi:MAG TPA: FAD-binding oxidoreductase [Solirubrobacteraceae bacterium]|nr:FAD-binding oxidoreductase [Solirubrobacteraceae bacterium]
MGERHTRRQFVRRSSAAALVVASTPALLTASASAAPTTAELRHRLRGALFTPRDDGWEAARALHNPRLDVQPRAIAFCESTADVAQVVRFGRARGWPVAARAGRHSFAGYSNAPGGIVADVSRIAAVQLEQRRPIVRVGGGAEVLDLYRDLVLRHGRALPVGTCPTVGITGLTLGGGFGRLMRRYGVTSDNLRGATVVLADGSVARCSEDQRADLFWALRGGGAGTAIVTQMRFAVRAAPTEAVAFTLAYPWTQAAAVVDAWQRTLPSAPTTLSYGRLRALRRPDGALTLTVSGHWYDTETKLRALLAPLIAAGPARQTLRRRTFEQLALPDSVRLRDAGPVVVDPPGFPNYQRSDFFSALLPAEAIAALLAQIERWPGVGGSGHEGGVQLDALGGAVNRPRSSATAFVHRDQRLHCAYLSFWGRRDPPAMAAACEQWTRDVHTAMRSHASGFAFQNYIDAELTDWERAYFGANAARLRAVKRRYDPRRRYAFAQG